MHYMGIDPGKGGGISIIDEDGRVKDIFTMPPTETDMRVMFDGLAHKGYFEDLQNPDLKAAIELVRSRPSQSAQSSFSFGMVYGWVRIACAFHLIPFREPTPGTWLKEFGMKKKPNEKQRAWKKRLSTKAKELFPGLELWERTIGEQLAVSDSLLIAEWLRRKEVG